MYLLHIRDACHKIMDYMQGVDEDAFMASSMLQDAIIRQISIIGEGRNPYIS